MNVSVQRTALVLAAAAPLLAGWGGCEKQSKRGSDLPEPLSGPVLRGPVTPAEANRDELSKGAVDLQSLYQGLNTKPGSGKGSALDVEQGEASPAQPSHDKRRGTLPDRDGPTKPASAAGLGSNEAIAIPDSFAPIRPTAKSKAGKASPDERTPQQRKQDAVAELATQLKPGIDGAREPMRAALPLIGLETISPGAADTELDTVSRAVTPDQRRALGITRDLFRAFATDPDLATGEPGAMARVLRDKADQLAGSATHDGLELGTVAMCQRVEGFGRFTPLGVNAFVAGRPAPMIVYTEVENFSQSRTAETPASEAENVEKWRVEVGQTVRLYLDSDGSEQLTLPESVVRDLSISRRHDFFLVQRIDLPRTLSVGNYNLKVAVRDVPSGALAERTIPIRVVADPSAIRDAPGRGAPGQIGKMGSGGQFTGTGK